MPNERSNESGAGAPSYIPIPMGAKPLTLADLEAAYALNVAEARN